ncbi:MAG: VWA domain-containing protein [Marinibacterium sp.]
MIDALAHLTLIRPWWLMAVPLVLVLWWRIRPRRKEGALTGDGAIAPHLAAALRTGAAERRRILPIDLFMLTGLLLTLAAAGPTWSRAPDPLVGETAPLVVALKVTDSMAQADLPPSRLERARFKILDLIAARAGARTALIAYAGSAHRVAPLTEDPGILRPLLQSLAPRVMPVQGDDPAAALDLAERILADGEVPGAVLFVLDDINPAAMDALAARTVPVLILLAAPDSVALPQLNRLNIPVIRLGADDRDIGDIERRLRDVQAAALRGDERLEWQDRAWWLAWPVALLVALWFRRGWTMRWGVVALALLLAPAPARADGVNERLANWFWTPDQQGQRAFDARDFSRAADLFTDPWWKGYALYRAGRYEEAITILSGLDTAEATFTQGLAEIKSRKYRPATRSFRTALDRRPDYPEAARNLDISMAIVAYVETAQEQSDTGEDRGIGADDIVFDNESQRGAQTRIEAPKEDEAPLTADQWMQAIDTDMGDFLRGRFLLDTAGTGEESRP